MPAYGGLSARTRSQTSEHKSGGPCVHGASNPGEHGCASEHAITSEDQARLTREGVKRPGSDGPALGVRAPVYLEGQEHCGLLWLTGDLNSKSTPSPEWFQKTLLAAGLMGKNAK